MPDARSARRGLLGWVLGPALALALAGGALAWAQRSPEGPEPIAYDRTPCSHCRMSVGDPRFAAQLQTRDGRVLDFDDPGCLLRYLADEHPAVRAIYFHHLRQDRWLTAAQAGFVPAGQTPMGYGLGVVDRAEPGALGLEQVQAQARLAAREGRRP